MAKIVITNGRGVWRVSSLKRLANITAAKDTMNKKATAVLLAFTQAAAAGQQVTSNGDQRVSVAVTVAVGATIKFRQAKLIGTFVQGINNAIAIGIRATGILG